MRPNPLGRLLIRIPHPVFICRNFKPFDWSDYLIPCMG